jgi:hypothetical protein
MLQKKTFELAVIPGYSASAAITPLSLPTDGVITEIRQSFDIHLNISTATNTFNTLGLALATYTLNTITATGKVFLSVTDPLVQLAHMYMRGMPVTIDPLVSTTTGADVVFRITLVYHPGSNISDPYDLTAGIIGPRYSSGGLVLNMNWPANTAAASAGGTIDNTTVMRVVVAEVVMDDAELAGLIANGFAEPSFTEQDYALTNATSATAGYQTSQNLPNQAFLRGATVLQENSSSVPTDANLNYFGLFKGANSQVQVVTGHWIEFAQQSQRNSGNYEILANGMNSNGGHNAGMGYQDFRRLIDTSNPAPYNGKAYSTGKALGLWGADFTNAPIGENYFGMSVGTTSGNMKYLWEQLTPLG